MARIRNQRQSQSDSIIGSNNRGGDPDTPAFKVQTSENLMQYTSTVSCVVLCIAWDFSGVILKNLRYNCKHSSLDYTSIVISIAWQVNSQIYATFRAPTLTHTPSFCLLSLHQASQTQTSIVPYES